ncbi:unnamed protein product [Closterium sp. Naga37s-1]|nr:unnamed protein product [Closterium sp. Naga37s-1]
MLDLQFEINIGPLNVAILRERHNMSVREFQATEPTSSLESEDARSATLIVRKARFAFEMCSERRDEVDGGGWDGWEGMGWFGRDGAVWRGWGGLEGMGRIALQGMRRLKRDYNLANRPSPCRRLKHDYNLVKRPVYLWRLAEAIRRSMGWDYDVVHVRRGDKLNPRF